MRLTTIAATLAMTLGLVSANYLIDNPFKMTQTDAIVSCGDADDILQIEYININPDPPEKGKVLQIDAKGTLSQDVVEGTYILLTVKVGLIKLIQKKLDFCEESAKIDKNCPLLAGEQTLKHEVELPKEIPPGKYTVNVKVYTPNDELVTCLNAMAVFKL